MTEYTTIKAGNLLAAEPFMLDPNFKRSVILLCEHHPSGTLGFILNKPIRMTINQLIVDFPDFGAEVYYGGPVQTDTVHFIHNVGDLLEGSQKVAEGIYWGGDFEQLKFLIQSGMITARNIRFFVGYSGWSSGQIDDELTSRSWVVSKSDENYIFNTKYSKLWERVLHNKGNVFSVIAKVPETLCWS